MKCNTCGRSEEETDFYPYLQTKRKECHYAYQKEYRSRQAGQSMTKDKKYALKKRYGLSVERFETMIQDQDGRCAICGQKPEETVAQVGYHDRLHVDHDHESGLVRGLLCNGCNRALGFINDDPDRALAMAFYLLEASQKASVA